MRYALGASARFEIVTPSFAATVCTALAFAIVTTVPRGPKRTMRAGELDPISPTMIRTSGNCSGSSVDVIEILSGARSAVAHGQKISTVAGRHHADVATKRKQTKTTRYRSFVAMTRSDGPRENPTRQCNTASAWRAVLMSSP